MFPRAIVPLALLLPTVSLFNFLVLYQVIRTGHGFTERILVLQFASSILFMILLVPQLTSAGDGLLRVLSRTLSPVRLIIVVAITLLSAGIAFLGAGLTGGSMLVQLLLAMPVGLLTLAQVSVLADRSAARFDLASLRHAVDVIRADLVAAAAVIFGLFITFLLLKPSGNAPAILAVLALTIRWTLEPLLYSAWYLVMSPSETVIAAPGDEAAR